MCTCQSGARGVNQAWSTSFEKRMKTIKAPKRMGAHIINSVCWDRTELENPARREPMADPMSNMVMNNTRARGRSSSRRSNSKNLH